MTAGPFDIATEPARSLLRITMRGHWDVATVALYETALRKAVQEMLAKGCPHGDMLALVDLREVKAQSQDVIAAYKERLDRADLAPRRLATLVSSALFKMQVQRIAIPNQRLFTSEDDAVEWLLSADESEYDRGVRA